MRETIEPGRIVRVAVVLAAVMLAWLISLVALLPALSEVGLPRVAGHALLAACVIAVIYTSRERTARARLGAFLVIATPFVYLAGDSVADMLSDNLSLANNLGMETYGQWRTALVNVVLLAWSACFIVGLTMLALAPRHATDQKSFGRKGA